RLNARPRPPKRDGASSTSSKAWAAARTASSRASDASGALDREPDLLAIRHLEVVAIRIGHDRVVAHGRSLVQRTHAQAALRPGHVGEAVDLLAARAPHAQVGDPLQ